MLVVTLREGEAVTVKNKKTGEVVELVHKKKTGKQVRIGFADPQQNYEIKRVALDGEG